MFLFSSTYEDLQSVANLLRGSFVGVACKRWLSPSVARDRSFGPRADVSSAVRNFPEADARTLALSDALPISEAALYPYGVRSNALLGFARQSGRAPSSGSFSFLRNAL